MPKQSAGLLLYRRTAGGIEVLLAHPGGPFWAKKDLGVWSIPKGEFNEDETPLAAARREFREEIGPTVDRAVGHAIDGDFLALTPLKQPSRKIVHAFALEADLDVTHIESNSFEMEWPPHSGKRQSFPEVDRAQWFMLDEARARIQQGQAPMLDELTAMLSRRSAAS